MQSEFLRSHCSRACSFARGHRYVFYVQGHTYIHVYWPDGEEKRLPKGIRRDPYDVLHSCWAVELQVCAVSVGERSLPPTLVSGVD